MISRLKRWMVKTVREYDQVVPAVVQNGTPVLQVFKITNGYLVHKHPNGVSRYEDNPSITYCPTPLDVARQIVNSEVLAKMGIASEPEVLKTSGITAGSFVTKI